MSKIYEQVDDALDFLDGINSKDRAKFMAKYLQDKKGFSTLVGDFQNFLCAEHGIEFNVMKNRHVKLYIKGELLHTYADFDSAFRVAVDKINNFPVEKPSWPPQSGSVSSTWKHYSPEKDNDFNGKKPFVIVPKDTPVNRVWAASIEDARKFTQEFVPDHKLVDDALLG
jgi:hypothetical protein